MEYLEEKGDAFSAADLVFNSRCFVGSFQVFSWTELDFIYMGSRRKKVRAILRVPSGRKGKPYSCCIPGKLICLLKWKGVSVCLVGGQLLIVASSVRETWAGKVQLQVPLSIWTVVKHSCQGY